MATVPNTASAANAVNAVNAASVANAATKPQNLDNGFPAEEFKALLDTLKQKQDNQKLDLDMKRFTQEQITQFCQALAKSKSVTHLRLWHSNFGDFGAAQLALVLKENRALRKLNLESIGITDEGAASLASVLKEKDCILSELNLNGNNITCKGAESLSEALRTNITLGRLDLSHNQIAQRGAECLCLALRDNRALQILMLHWNIFGREAGKYFGEVLKQNHVLRVLSLRCVQLGDEGMKDLAEGLRQNRSLENLDIGVNDLGPASGEYLGRAMKENRALLKLFLPYNKLGPLGTSAFCNGLKDNKTLLGLDINSNEVGTLGCQAIAGVLGADGEQGNSTGLQFLFGSDNGTFGDEGVKDLCAALKVNKSLQVLVLCKTTFGPQSGAYLRDMLKVNQTLEAIDIGDPRGIDAKGFVAIEEGLRENYRLEHFYCCGAYNIPGHNDIGFYSRALKICERNQRYFKIMFLAAKGVKGKLELPLSEAHGNWYEASGVQVSALNQFLNDPLFKPGSPQFKRNALNETLGVIFSFITPSRHDAICHKGAFGAGDVNAEKVIERAMPSAALLMSGGPQPLARATTSSATVTVVAAAKQTTTALSAPTV